MYSCKHDYICPLYCSYVHQQYLWLVMPELLVTVLDLLKTVTPVGFDEGIISAIMYDVLNALDYLHSNSQIHRDVKLSNLLINMSGKTVLSDFGVAAMMGPTEKFKTTYVGSPLYMAPEVTSNQ